MNNTNGVRPAISQILMVIARVKVLVVLKNILSGKAAHCLLFAIDFANVDIKPKISEIGKLL